MRNYQNNMGFPIMKGFSCLKRRTVAASVGTALLLLASASQADFVNGNFASGDFTGWTQNAYLVPSNGITGTFPPTTEAHLQLTASGTPMSAVLPPGSASSTGGVVAWSGNAARVHNEVNGDNRRVSSIEQTITVVAGDVDTDGKVHVRFTASPVLEDPNHNANEQPYFFIEITGPGGTSLYHTYNFAGEAGVPWQTNGGYKFTDWQAFDVALEPTDVTVGDTLTLKAIAAGCSPTAHAGAIYIRDVRTARQVTGSSLWVTAAGPATVCAGNTVTYTYTYENNGSDAMTNVMVEVEMPQTDDPLTANFVSIGNPSFGGGSCAAPANPGDPALCSIGTLQPGDTGTFTMTVSVPSNATGTSLNNGNYTISGDNPSGGIITQLGPLVRTVLNACPRPVVQVPTLGQWGLLLLGLAMVGVGTSVSRRRRMG